MCLPAAVPRSSPSPPPGANSSPPGHPPKVSGRRGAHRPRPGFPHRHRKRTKREPQEPAARIGDHLHVHAVSAVLVGVGASVAAAVALGKPAVEQEEVRVCLAQGFEQAGRSFGEQADDRGGVSLGGGLADFEPGGNLRPGVCSRRYTTATSARWDGRGLQQRSPSRVTTSIVTHSTSAFGRSSPQVGFPRLWTSLEDRIVGSEMEVSPWLHSGISEEFKRSLWWSPRAARSTRVA